MQVATVLADLEILCADSRQVYRGMDIGTAKPTAEDRRLVPHHGLDLVDPDEPFSVAAYRRHAVGALEGVARRGRAALLVGGTGLYLRAVAGGLHLEGAPPDLVLRGNLEERLDREGLDGLADELRHVAPMTAERTDLANPRRVVRALERARSLGDVPASPPRGYRGRVLWLGLRLSPETHRERIRERTERHFRTGLVEEAVALAARYDPTLPAFSALGYKEALTHASGERSLEEAIDATARATWRYARRQATWFRAEPAIEWLEGAESAGVSALERVRAFLAG
jgi:tRNA dimethylallyltransferase